MVTKVSARRRRSTPVLASEERFAVSERMVFDIYVIDKFVLESTTETHGNRAKRPNSSFRHNLLCIAPIIADVAEANT